MPASSLRENPSSSTNGVVKASASASANLNRITKASTAMAASRREEVEKGADRRHAHARDRVLARMRGVLGLGRDRLRRLDRQQRRHHSDQHQHRHHDEAAGPGRLPGEAQALEAADQEQRAGAGDERADPVGGHIGGHAGGLLLLGQALDPERIDQDVLGRRRGGDHERRERDRQRRERGVAERQQHDRRHQPQLGEHQPAAPAAEQRATGSARRARRSAAPTGT